MTDLLLSPIGRHRPELADVEDQFVVLLNGQIVGTIVKTVMAPKCGPAWLWSITGGRYSARWPRQGRAHDKAEAMADFRHAWTEREAKP
jgi:hypothetical protein